LFIHDIMDSIKYQQIKHTPTWIWESEDLERYSEGKLIRHYRRKLRAVILSWIKDVAKSI